MQGFEVGGAEVGFGFGAVGVGADAHAQGDDFGHAVSPLGWVEPGLAAVVEGFGGVGDLFGLGFGGLGFSAGFWVIFVTIGAEQFGTNLRSTVATTVPNFARGMQVPINESFKYLKGAAVTGSVISAGYIVGAVCFGLAFIALWGLKETFHRDLDYVEEISVQ